MARDDTARLEEGEGVELVEEGGADLKGDVNEQNKGEGEKKEDSDDILKTKPKFKYTKWRRFLVFIGYRRHVLKGSVQQVPYRKSFKWALIILLTLAGVFLTPSLLPKWIGLTWAAPDDLCDGREEKLEAINATIRECTMLVEAGEQVQEAKGELDRLSNIAETQYEDWPNGCPPETIQQAIDEANDRQCQEEKCKWGYNLLGTDINCIDVSVACGLADSLGRSRAWQEYQVFQAQKAANPNITVEDYELTISDRSQQVIKRLLRQVDIASNLYLLYVIVGLIISAPLFVYKPSFRSRFLGRALTINKPLWVLIVVVIWSTYDALWAVLKDTDWAFWWTTFTADPCFVDADFTSKRIQAISDTCNEIAQLGASFVNTTFGIQDVSATAFVYRACDKAAPELEDFVLTAEEWENATYVGKCNVTDLNDKTAVPHDSDPDLVNALFASGLIAQLMIKFFVIQFIFHLMAFLEPLCTNSGQIERFGEADYSDDDIKQLLKFKRDTHRCPMTTYGVILALIAANIAYASTQND